MRQIVAFLQENVELFSVLGIALHQTFPEYRKETR